jgi:hypothetical protein
MELAGVGAGWPTARGACAALGAYLNGQNGWVP